MSSVTVVPLGVTFDVPDGETVFHTAVDAGYRWPTVCGGAGSCRTCYMIVVEGEHGFEEPDDWEQEGLDELGETVSGCVRLACQALVQGDSTVRKVGVKPLTEES